MKLPILNKRLVIFAGKGGVGKTTISSSFALLAQRYGKKVLIVELSPEEKIPFLFGEEKTGYRTKEIYENIFSINITPENALKEYGLMKLKFKTAYKIVFENELIKRLLRVIPGMNELLVIGKIWHLEQEFDKKTKKHFWDIIIVDTPATGKGLSILGLPKTILETVSYGPLASDTKLILDLLLDEKRTCINIVTTPEELPVLESIELLKEIKEKLKLPFGFLIANSLYETQWTSFDKTIFARLKSVMKGKDREIDELIKVCSFLLNRIQMQKFYLEKLYSFSNTPPILIPFIPSLDSPLSQLKTISIYLEKEIERISI